MKKPTCAIPDCGLLAASDAPLPLCDEHLAIAGDWHTREHGLIDTLPSPCLACGSPLGVRYRSGWICAVCEWRHGEVPDAELAPPRVDIVYYLRFGERVKIGTTSNPRQRFGAIWHDEILAFERGDRMLEHRRHLEFDADRYTGTEWFRLSDGLRAHIDVVAAGVEDPWVRYARWVSEANALR